MVTLFPCVFLGSVDKEPETSEGQSYFLSFSTFTTQHTNIFFWVCISDPSCYVSPLCLLSYLSSVRQQFTRVDWFPGGRVQVFWPPHHVGPGSEDLLLVWLLAGVRPLCWGRGFPCEHLTQGTAHIIKKFIIICRSLLTTKCKGLLFWQGDQL